MPATALVLGGMLAQMTYRGFASLAFNTAGERSAAATSIDAAIASRSVGSSKTTFVHPSKGRMLIYDVDGGAIDMQSLFTSFVNAGDANGALSGSVAHWHACYHGDLTNQCAVTGRRDW